MRLTGTNLLTDTMVIYSCQPGEVEAGEPGIIFGYLGSLRSAQATGNPVPKINKEKYSPQENHHGNANTVQSYP